jgi:hypothetical protein
MIDGVRRRLMPFDRGARCFSAPTCWQTPKRSAAASPHAVGCRAGSVGARVSDSLRRRRGPGAGGDLDRGLAPALIAPDGRYALELPSSDPPERLLADLTATGARLVSLQPIRDTLEDYFMKQVATAEAATIAGGSAR